MSKQHLRNTYVLASIVLVACFGTALAYWSLSEETVVAPPVETNESMVVENQINVESEESVFIDGQLQQLVESFVGDRQMSVVISDLNSDVILASVNAEDRYFSASLYKLYFAFLASVDMQAGDLDDNEIISDGRSLNECLKLMISQSDSPCGEALLTKYDYTQATDRLRKYGLPDIDTAAFEVSARDMDVLLREIFLGSSLDQARQADIQQALKEQIYDNGLRAGFAGSTVYDKVGFSSIDWHDVGVVEVGDQRLVVSVLSENVGSQAVFEIAQRISRAIK